VRVASPSSVSYVANENSRGKELCHGDSHLNRLPCGLVFVMVCAYQRCSSLSFVRFKVVKVLRFRSTALTWLSAQKSGVRLASTSHRNGAALCSFFSQSIFFPARLKKVLNRNNFNSCLYLQSLEIL
jgi:hypothetical protein